MKNWVILVCAAVVFGCASDPATRQQVAEMEVTRMLPPSVSLSEFDSFELAPLELAAALSARPEKVEVAGELEARLKAVIDPMLAQWNSEAGGAGDRTLVIRPFVQALHVPSGASASGLAPGPEIPTSKCSCAWWMAPAARASGSRWCAAVPAP